MVYLYEMFSLCKVSLENGKVTQRSTHRIQDPTNIIIRNGNNGLARLAKLVQVRQDVNGLVQAPSEPPKENYVKLLGHHHELFFDGEDNLYLRGACLLLVINGR